MPRASRVCSEPGCPVILTGSVYRCPTHQREADQRRGSPSTRGLGREHRRRTRDLLTTATVCAVCGRPPTEGDPLTGDHVIPVSRGGERGPLRPAHRSCNSRRRDRSA